MATATQRAEQQGTRGAGAEGGRCTTRGIGALDGVCGASTPLCLILAGEISASMGDALASWPIVVKSPFHAFAVVQRAFSGRMRYIIHRRATCAAFHPLLAGSGTQSSFAQICLGDKHQ